MKITLATKITIARIFLIIPTVIVFILAEYLSYNDTAYLACLIVSAVLFTVCCATDFLDGHIARKTGTVSDLGKLLDPLADKVIIVIMLFLIVLFKDGLTMNGVFIHNGVVIALLSGLILSRELLISVFRSIAARKNLVLAADVFGKIKTVLLDISVSALMLAGLHPVIGWLGTVLFYLGSFFAVYSGINYICKNKHVFAQDSDAETALKENTEQAAEVQPVTGQSVKEQSLEEQSVEEQLLEEQPAQIDNEQSFSEVEADGEEQEVL